MRWLAVLAFLLGVACSRGEPAARGGGSGSGGSGSAALTLVSLTPSATEVVAALGATSLLIGVDEYSQYPPEVRGLPKVGSFLAPNLEAIVRLSPSLVIVDDVHVPAAGALRDAGIETVACPVHALADVEKALRTVGARIGRGAEAERVVREIDAAIRAAEAARPAVRPRVLAVIDREAGGLGALVAAGPGSWADELLAIAGGDNVLAASVVRYPKISLEEVLRAKPDVILDLSFAARDGGTRAWSAVDVPAVARGRVVGIFEPYLAAPSPRVAAAIAAVSKAIAP